MKFQTRYDESYKVQIDQSEQKSMTKVSEMDSCDINKIMERFNRTGQLPALQKLDPRYGEAIAMDFAEAQNLVIEARDAFSKLPALTRKHFHNDPALYMNTIANAKPEQFSELKKLGILIERQPTTTDVLKEINKNLKESIKDQNRLPEKA